MAAETILIVDDDQIMVELLAIWLEEAGYATATATDDATAVTAYRSVNQVVAVVCDFELRSCTGCDVIDALRVVSPELRAIVISGHSEQRIRTECSSRSAHFLQKPFDPSDLVELITRT